MRAALIELIASGHRVRLEMLPNGVDEGQPLSVHLHLLDPEPSELSELLRISARFTQPLPRERVSKVAYQLLDALVTEHEPDYVINDLLAAMVEYDRREGTDLMMKLSARLWELKGGHYRPSRRS